MADAKLTALTAASALAAADLFYVSQSAASRKATGTQFLTLVGTEYVAKAGGTMTGALTLPNGTAAAPSLTFPGGGTDAGIYSGSAGTFSFSCNGAERLWITGGGVYVTAAALGVYNNSGFLSFGTAFDIKFYRDAAATLAQRNGTTQQIFRLYNTYTDSSNYERLTLTGVAGTSVNITAETLGTGGDNLNIVLTPAGTGSVFLGSSSSVDTSGNLAANGFYLSGNVGLWVNNTFKLKKEAVLGWSSTYSVADAYDTAFYKSVAGRIDVIDGISDTAFRDLKLRNLLNVEYHQMTEMTAPAAPATNSVRIYAEDNGSGKTRLMALFASGVAQQIAIEP